MLMFKYVIPLQVKICLIHQHIFPKHVHSMDYLFYI